MKHNSDFMCDNRITISSSLVCEIRAGTIVHGNWHAQLYDFTLNLFILMTSVAVYCYSMLHEKMTFTIWIHFNSVSCTCFKIINIYNTYTIIYIDISTKTGKTT